MQNGGIMPNLSHNNLLTLINWKETMITKRQWEEMTKTDSHHLLRLENETYLGYQLQRFFYFLKHLIIKN